MNSNQVEPPPLRARICGTRSVPLTLVTALPRYEVLELGRPNSTFIVARNRGGPTRPSDQPASEIDPQQLVHAADQIARIDGPVLDRLSLGIGGADHLAAFEAAAGNHARRRPPEMVPPAIPGRFPVDLRRAAELAAAPDDRTRPTARGSARSAISVDKPLSRAGNCRRMT